MSFEQDSLVAQRLHLDPSFQIPGYEYRDATEPMVCCEPDVFPLASQLEIETDYVVQILREQGQSEARARSVCVKYFSLQRLAGFKYGLAADTRLSVRDGNKLLPAYVGGFYEPSGVLRHDENTPENVLTRYWHFIGLPIWPGALKPEGVALISDALLHELAHAALAGVSSPERLYKSGPDGKEPSLRGRRVFGIIPVSLAVAYLERRGYSRDLALHDLEPEERKVRGLERRYADLPIVQRKAAPMDSTQ